MLRVLHVSDCYLPRLGGIETQVHELARRQRLAGDDAEVVTATPRWRHDRAGRDEVDGVPVHRSCVDLPFELPVHPRGGREVAAVVRRARDAGAGFDVAHVHVGVVSPFAHQGLVALARLGVPTVVTVHSMWGPAAPVLRALARAWGLSRRPVVLSAVSAAAAAPLRPLAGGEEVLVVPNGIDVGSWQVEPLPRPDDEVVLAAVQRLAPRKRCLPLLEVLAQARRLLPATVRLRAVVVGEGPLRGRMERRVAEPDLAGWVELPGRWAAPAIRELYRRADVFVAASTLESFGIAALEARTAGVPVVARSGTGIAEFVRHGVNGLLAGDDAGLAEAVAELAGDPRRRAAIAARNRAQAPAASWPDVLRACERAYTSAVARSAGR